jgi:hypothetical protein
VTRVHDLDGDGAEDFLIATPGLVAGATAIGALAISSATRSFLPLLYAVPGGSTTFAAAIASIGDVDGDGEPDLAFGAPGDGDRGVVYLLLSGTSGYVAVSPGTLVTAGAAFGTAIAGLPDVDGDGRFEVLVGAPHHSAGGDVAGCDDAAGVAYVGDCTGRVLIIPSTTVSGASAGVADCLAPPTAGGFSITRRLGATIRALGPSPRLDAAGAQRALVGSPGVKTSNGRATLYDVVWDDANERCVTPPFFRNIDFTGTPDGGPPYGELFGAALGP